MSIPGCPNHSRHWYSAFGVVGLRLPYCARCSWPNGKPLKRDEWTELIDAYETGVARLDEYNAAAVRGEIAERARAVS